MARLSMQFVAAGICAWALSVGCTPPADRGGPSGGLSSLSSPDVLYPIGVLREDLRRRGSLGREFLQPTEPTDVFARLTVREMISIGKPRPTSFERFMIATPAGVNTVDYVFYDSQGRVIYSARRTERDS